MWDSRRRVLGSLELRSHGVGEDGLVAGVGLAGVRQELWRELLLLETPLRLHLGPAPSPSPQVLLMASPLPAVPSGHQMV